MSNPDSIGARLLRMWLWLMTKLLVLAGLSLVLLIVAWLWFKQEKLLFQPTVLPPDTVLAQAPDVKEVAIEVDGARLSALHLRRERAKGVVFFLHGNAGNLQTWFVNTDFYRQANFDLFMIDYRGFGKSTGQITSEAELRADVRKAFDAVAPQYAGRKIVVYGRSLGSGLAAGLSAELAQNAKLPQPDLTVLVSPYSSMVALAGDAYPYVPAWVLRYPLRSDDAVGQIKGPLLLFHGSNDKLIAPKHSAALKARAPRAEVVILSGADHNNVQTFAAYRDRFAAALAGL